MRKRYQVFVSSTYEDLKTERQAAVEAILKSGNIPAGMELFTAGDKSQMEVIRRWIDESDIFILILGARYGSIESSSNLSYTELEFDYAAKSGKPFFSIVMSDEGREAKVKAHGTSVMETKNPELYKRFRDRVLSNMCSFFATPQEVKLAVLETLPMIITSRNLVGWVSGADVQPSGEISKELVRLSQENAKLREEGQQLRKKVGDLTNAGLSFEDLYSTLQKEQVTLPADLTGGKETKFSLLELAMHFADDLGRSVTNAFNSSKTEGTIYYNVAAPLVKYGLVEHGKTPSGVQWTRLQLSKEGIKFFSRAASLHTLADKSAASSQGDAVQKGGPTTGKALPSGRSTKKRS